MGLRKMSISKAFFMALFQNVGKKFKLVENPLPEDTTIFKADFIINPGIIEIIIGSKEFSDSLEMAPIEELESNRLPTFKTVE